MTIQILDLTPVNRYGDGSPIYKFSTGFPSRGVRAVGEIFPTIEEAHKAGVTALAEYCARDRYGNMGSVLGVVAVPGGFRGVIVTYHSNT